MGAVELIRGWAPVVRQRRAAQPGADPAAMIAAGGTFIAVLATTSAVTGTATLDLPWPLIAAVAAAAFAVTSVTSVITSWFATRTAPVGLLGATE